ncbi:MAG: phosphotransferase family protein [Cyclobacteriaceae bacterium]|nr:phosphotransferase family protein [Cyclobacteriaceae bacterium]
MIEPLEGGMTNTNFKVCHKGEYYVVRIGTDIPEHGVMRFNENAASLAAYKAGISPEVIHHEPGALVIRYIHGETLKAHDVRENDTLTDILQLLKTCHTEIPRHLRSAVLTFWVFQVNRFYLTTLSEIASNNKGFDKSELARLMEINVQLESEVGKVNIVFCHNDLLASNIIRTDKRLWLIDWEYAGFNSPLFDLSNLAFNNGLSINQELEMLGSYFDCKVDEKFWRSYMAMKCASTLRETLWGMVSERYSKIVFDFKAYAKTNLTAFDQTYKQFLELD